MTRISLLMFVVSLETLKFGDPADMPRVMPGLGLRDLRPEAAMACGWVVCGQTVFRGSLRRPKVSCESSGARVAPPKTLRMRKVFDCSAHGGAPGARLSSPEEKEESA
ncbi:hypothetical protein NDU88_005261 [Pleurodeles waltl]|uniref:Secreted protein n=1 Tax=Pleurodeles waltl TaxID=8319 RepID=A0AAV7L707_PLEWA|nr:hypothetical protein NDU88_005261 [Pleurodeles waltl]